MKNKIIFFFILFLFIADRLLKYLSFKGEFFIIPKFFKFTFFANPHLAFSLPVPQNATIILSILIISILSLYLFIIFYKRQKKLANKGSFASLRMTLGDNPKRELALALFAILLGALSNFYDRLAFGFVIDYLYLWPISYFNLADLIIGMGIILYALQSPIRGRAGS